MKIFECEKQLEKLLNDLKFYSDNVNRLNDIIIHRKTQDDITDLSDPILIQKTFSFLHQNVNCSTGKKFMEDPMVAKFTKQFITSLRNYFLEEMLKLEVPTKTDEVMKIKQKQNVN